MNINKAEYNQFALCREIFETPDLIRHFDQNQAKAVADLIAQKSTIFLTGEGSSRLFPAGNLIWKSRLRPSKYSYQSASASEANEYDLRQSGVIGLSNSGRTSELVRLFSRLNEQGHDAVAGVTAGPLDGPLSAISKLLHQLECGPEEAVAATKSVVNQALFLDAVDANIHERLLPDLHHLGNLFQQILEMSLVDDIIRLFERASTIFYAGRSNGVGEELALKTNEITRKKSVFLPGTYALHGIEEVMDGSEVLLLIDPFVEDEYKFQKFIGEGVGIPVVALSTRQTIFPTIRIPYGGHLHSYLELAAGWNLLVETGLRLQVNIDKGLRARKIGNEVSLNSAQL